MRAVTSRRAWCLLVPLALASCAKPIRVTVDVGQGPPATVRAHLIKGKDGPSPDQCQTPCGMSIAPDSTNELTLESEGYYPATFELTYDNVRAAAGGHESTTLVVPLVGRPAPRAQPAQDPPPDDAAVQ